jgi:hypothetical protein
MGAPRDAHSLPAAGERVNRTSPVPTRGPAPVVRRAGGFARFGGWGGVRG